MPLSLLILTGQSGSGKSTAIRTLEDHGYFCVDNIPTRLVEGLIELLRDEAAVERLAIVMDVREQHFTERAPALVGRLKQLPLPVRVVYLEAMEPALIRRYSETRRRHPLDHGDGLRAAIARERSMLAPMRELADGTLDTSAMTPHDLRARVVQQIVQVSAAEALRVSLLSFGFKHGVPLEADMVFDVRFLANPYFDPAMRVLTGLDASVRDYVVAGEEGKQFLDQADEFLAFLIPRYQREGKRYLTVAVGCTGGRHRSVAMAVALANRMQRRGHATDLRHRDIEEQSS